MVANRSLGNPTDRDDNGGLRNRVCHGSRTEAAWETERTATVPYRVPAPHFYPNNPRPPSRTYGLINLYKTITCLEIT